MKNLIITITCLLLTGKLFAQQNKIVTSGKIEFEKRINLHAVAKNELGEGSFTEVYKQILADYKSKTPQFGTLNSTLIFNNNKTLFTPLTPDKPINNFSGNPINKQFNTIYTDLTANSSVAQKEIYGDLFLVKDSVRKITWRLTDETQDVAGYTCRRANGLILDSVYVVAFYTDRIWVSGGPESFSGLPGMILKVALPHENVVWTATKVTVEDIPPATILPPKKGEVINNKDLAAKLKVAMKNWGSAGPYEMKIYLL
ncbi:MAG: GLPGLI family protein [Mucilaginibacter sp.]